jgi:antitoxin component YwqK of YwqJK toxin-antitoxin module|tara:strand:- start:93 stop:497 length:405 start_codon:yes stop_codon:yes gene_type:complete
MKRLFIISLLFLSVGLSQKLYEVIETYENGNIESITYHKKIRDSIGKVKKEGYYENGQKSEEVTYKDGKKDGLFTSWYENGQKSGEGTHKDGERYGLGTEWYKNGQMKSEGTWKDGEQISGYEWDEDGSVIMFY